MSAWSPQPPRSGRSPTRSRIAPQLNVRPSGESSRSVVMGSERGKGRLAHIGPGTGPFDPSPADGPGVVVDPGLPAGGPGDLGVAGRGLHGELIVALGQAETQQVLLLLAPHQPDLTGDDPGRAVGAPSHDPAPAGELDV